MARLFFLSSIMKPGMHISYFAFYLLTKFGHMYIRRVLNAWNLINYNLFRKIWFFSKIPSFILFFSRNVLYSRTSLSWTKWFSLTYRGFPLTKILQCKEITFIKIIIFLLNKGSTALFYYLTEKKEKKIFYQLIDGIFFNKPIFSWFFFCKFILNLNSTI